jgi:hypothetical protein
MMGVNVLDDIALDRLASEPLHVRDTAGLTMLPSRRESGFDLDAGYRVGHALHEGEGRNALGSPVLAVGRLAEVIRSQSWAPALAGGEVITTGTLTALPRVHPGERWRVDVVGATLAPLELDLCA